MNQPRSPSKSLPREMSRYSCIRTVGAGSFGAAILVSRGREHFIAKEMNIGKMSPIEREAVDSEVKILSALKHPNIVRYEECIPAGHVLYIVMEFADGGDLYQKIAGLKEPMEEEGVLYLFTQISLAVKHLHSRKILHRDLKSQNVFLTSNNIVKLGDFGLATALRHTWQHAHSLCGTPNYFSPELVAGRPYNNKTDIWAMGCILYELLAQRFAFSGNSLTEIMQSIQCDQPAPVPSHYSEGLRSILSRMLCKEQAIRPSIDALMRAKILQASLLRIVKENEAGAKMKIEQQQLQQQQHQRQQQQQLQQQLQQQQQQQPVPSPPMLSADSPQIPSKDIREDELTQLENEILSDPMGLATGDAWLTEATKALDGGDDADKETYEEFGDETLEMIPSSTPRSSSLGINKKCSMRSERLSPSPSSRCMERRDSLGGEIEGLLAEFSRLDNVIGKD